jgi:hypothetical protein
MSIAAKDYKPFLKFLETYSPGGFKAIDPNDPLIVNMEKQMEKNDQFIYIADAIRMEILFTSKRSSEMIGVKPDDLSFYHFMVSTNPKDIQRLNLGRTKLLKMAQDIFIAGKGSALISTNFKIRTPGGGYSEFLIQGYLFYSNIPYETVYFLKIHTNIDWFKKLKHGYHYYIGNDLAYFRYPDEKMLQIGNVFTKREFEIIKLIESGMSSEEIADKLYLSHYTVNTHRGNILKKTKKAQISDLIYDLKERGLL